MPQAVHTLDRGGSAVREKTVAVRCEFCKEGKAVSELLEGSFRLYLRRALDETPCRGPEANDAVSDH